MRRALSVLGWSELGGTFRFRRRRSGCPLQRHTCSGDDNRLKLHFHLLGEHYRVAWCHLVQRQLLTERSGSADHSDGLFVRHRIHRWDSRSSSSGGSLKSTRRILRGDLRDSSSFVQILTGGGIPSPN